MAAMQQQMLVQGQQLQELREAQAASSSVAQAPVSPPAQVAATAPGQGGVFGLLPLVDTRGLGKPEVFKGDPATFNDWVFILRSYMGAMDRRYQALLQKAESSEIQLWNRLLTEEEQGLSTQLYYVLVMLCRGRALDKLHNCGDNEGVEAYRQLYLEYNPKLNSRYVGLLLEILRYKFEGDLVSCIESFERKVREYEKQSGKDVDDETVIGIVILGVEDQTVKEHLIRHSSRLDTWKKMRAEIIEIARTQKYLQSTPQPMDVGGLPKKPHKGSPKGAKGDGKGDKGKSTGKDAGGKKGGDKGGKGDKKKGPCFYCQKPGHTKAECRKRAADLKKAENKGRTVAGDRVRMNTVTGEALKLGKCKTSSLKHGDVPVEFNYRESNSVQFPVISMSEASQKGTWLVVGPSHQFLVGRCGGEQLKKALKEVPKVPLVKDKGVYWLEVADSAPGVEVADSAPPAQVDARPLGDAPLEEPPEPEGEAGRKAKHKKVPPSVSAEMRAEHELTHLPFRSWCESCVVGKGTEDFHQRRQEEKKEDVARYCIDYCFFTKALSQEAASTDAKDILEAKAGAKAVLVCRDQKSGALFTGVANSKGAGDPYSMAFALEGMKFCGHPDMIVVSDTEPAIKSLGEELVKRYPKKASSQPVPKGDHKANGAAERAVLELSNQVTEDSLVFPWMVRHAGWLCTRYGIKHDGRTAYERLRGRTYKGEVVEFGEVVLFRISNQNLRKLEDRWSCGVWLGKSLSNDEHFVATANGIQRCRSVRRRVEAKRFDPTFVLRMVGCPGCDTSYGDAPVKHNATCRARFEKLCRAPVVAETAPGDDTVEPSSNGGDDPMGAGPGPSDKQASSEAAGSRASGSGSVAAGSGAPSERKRGGLDLSDSPLKEARTSEPARASDSPRSPSRKREAEGKTEEVEEEMVAGLPTMHVAAMVISDRMIASAAKELEKPVYDEKTGKLLDPEKVKIGRMKEMTKMESFGVKGDITYDEAKAKGLRLVKSRWIDTEKEIEGKPGVRSRWERLPFECIELPGESKSKKLIGRYDVSVAFFHADNSEKIGVIPPASEGTPNIIWELHKAMNGTREASRQWGVKIREVKTRHNFDELLLCPNTYYLKEHDLCLSCHGDDFLASGEREALDMLDKIMEENYEVKVLPRIGDPAHGGEVSEGRHLGRLIKWTGSGFTWECDPKFAPQVIEELELKGCKGVDTPASKATGVGNREVEKELSRERAEVFRRVTGTILYMAVDRPSLQYAASELAEGMSKPLEIHWLRLKRVGKYIAKYPVEKWHFELQEAPAQLESFSDSDWATDRRTRRSMSSTYQRFGKHLLDTSCGRQSLVALSSGEAEFYAMVKTAAEGKLTTEILRHFGWKVEHRVLSDSSAARSMAQRVGCGKVKHLSLKEMWIQQAVRNKELSIGKVDTLMNISDLGTKALEAARMDSLMKQLPLERGIVAAVVSCCLEKVQAAPVQSEEVWWLNLYLGLVHLLALVGLLFASYKGVEVLLKGWHWLCGRGNRPSVAQSSAAMALSRRDTPRGSGAEEAQHSAEVPTTRMPSVPEGTSVLRSPAGQSDSDRMSFRGDARTGVDDRVRVVRDTLSLLTVEELKSGLRVEGLQVTGLKQDLMERLLHKFDGGDESLSDRPSTKQLRYVLYIHRHRAQCRIQYENLRTREETSKWIANWKV
ncbi:RE2 [Symbiodinium natans]|uniref:RE2 protein n=1 Tax=Symbiodinium natans TaxID=878477 RepID=A0A812JF37_9DINO|nr:RE2 [Symbiodinium natans]